MIVSYGLTGKWPSLMVLLKSLDLIRLSIQYINHKKKCTHLGYINRQLLPYSVEGGGPLQLACPPTFSIWSGLLIYSQVDCD